MSMRVTRKRKRELKIFLLGIVRLMMMMLMMKMMKMEA